MNREFGFTFIGANSPKVNGRRILSFAVINVENGIEDINYLHPECHDMLNPQEGDLLEHRDGFVGKFDADISKLDYVRCYMGTTAMNDTEERFKIIQRDNKAFFQPESEE